MDPLKAGGDIRGEAREGKSPARPFVKKLGTKPSLKPQSRSSSSSLRAQRQMLLYVEHDDENWHVAKKRLGDRYDLVRATQAEQACELLSRRGSEFAAILMDVELFGSGLTGVELARLLRGRPGRDGLPAYARAVPVLDVPVIFVTAHEFELGDDHAEIADARVIRKPIDFNALNIAIAQSHLERVMSRGRERS
jgi:CheY-like chemotaxis protein